MIPSEKRTLQIADRRMEELARRIRNREPWEDIEFAFDQVQSKIDQLLKKRDRHYDS